MDNPLVSVVLPVYNGEKFLAEAVGSVLEQSYRPIEILVVDDGSTDGTARVAARFADQIRYFYRPNSGPAAARNFGIRNAKGKFIAFIDADDLWPDDKLNLQMGCFNAFPKVKIVQGLINRIKLPGLVKGRLTGADIDFPFIYTNLGSMVMRRSIFEKIGYFDVDLPFHEDTDFWLRAREQGIQILIQRKIALIYRIHGRNMTTGEDIKTTGFLKILRKSIERRHKSSGLVSGLVKEVCKLSFIPDLLEKGQQSDQSIKKAPKSWPLVSVILYANGFSVSGGQALASIRGQDYHPMELITIGSQLDQVQAQLADYSEPLIFIDGPSDLASGLNAAIHRSNGEMIAFLDLETVWASGKLKTQVACLLEHPTDGYITGRIRHILLPEMKYPSSLIDGLSIRKSLGDLLGTLLVRRSTFAQVGGFGVGLPGMEDTDWLLRAKDKGFPQKMLPDIFLFRYVQPDSHVVGIENMKAALLESVRSSVHRKRNVP